MPVLGEDGKPVTEAAGIVYITGRVTVYLDGQAYHHADVGRCVFTGDTPEALDMAIAGARTDRLTRCFRQCGEQFGNRLYDEDVAKTAGLETGAPDQRRSNGKAKPPAQSGNSLQYLDGFQVDPGNPAEVEAFNAFRAAHQNQSPASREALRAWASNQNGNQ